MKILKIFILVCVLGAIPYNVAYPQDKEQSAKKAFGVRSGYGSGPDQFVLGAQATLGKTLKVLQLAPSIDIGFGDGMTSYLMNMDFRLLSLSPPKTSSRIYAGFGGSLAVYDQSAGGADTEIGVSLIAGVTLPMGGKNDYTLEVRAGHGDMPDFRILFGILMGSRPGLKK